MDSMQEANLTRQGPPPPVGRLMRELGNDLAWEVLASVALAPKRVSAIVEDVGRQMSVVSKYLKRLHAVGLVTYERHKNEHVFRVNTDQVETRSGSVIAEVRGGQGVTVVVTVPAPLPMQTKHR